jgi:hypothetical protein
LLSHKPGSAAQGSTQSDCTKAHETHTSSSMVHQPEIIGVWGNGMGLCFSYCGLEHVTHTLSPPPEDDRFLVTRTNRSDYLIGTHRWQDRGHLYTTTCVPRSTAGSWPMNLTRGSRAPRRLRHVFSRPRRAPVGEARGQICLSVPSTFEHLGHAIASQG